MIKNQTVEEIRHAIREIHKRKISVHGMFVFGFDSGTVETMNATVRFALAKKIATVHFLILTPFPGSSLYVRMLAEGRLLDTAWDTFDGQHVKFISRRITPWELQGAMARLLRGSLIMFIIGLHAGALNRRWRRLERNYLRRLRLFLPDSRAG